MSPPSSVASVGSHFSHGISIYNRALLILTLYVSLTYSVTSPVLSVFNTLLELVRPSNQRQTSPIALLHVHERYPGLVFFPLFLAFIQETLETYKL